MFFVKTRGIVPADPWRVNSPRNFGEKMVNYEVMPHCMSFRLSWPVFFGSAFLALLLVSISGCGIKSEVKVAVPPMVGAARTASLQELVTMIQDSRNRITSLKSGSIKITLTTGKDESGVLQKYHGARAYLLLRRPDDLVLNVMEPIALTTLVQLSSRGDQFQLWNLHDNKLYIGRNEAKAFELEDNGKPIAFTARPTHIFDAILPAPLPIGAPGVFISKTECQDAAAKYYILAIMQYVGSTELHTLRWLWIERSQMAVVKDVSFTDEGEIAGTIDYSDFARVDGFLLPKGIRIDRPMDGYSLDLHASDWQVNPKLEDDNFILNVPPDVERVILKEKRSTGL